jgi:hypothetical protein
MELLKGEDVSGVQTVACEGSFENEQGNAITSYEALQEPGSLYFGISSFAIG